VLACEFFDAVTLRGTRLYVLAVIEHASRRIRVLGTTEHPITSWVTQAAKNLVMDLEDARCQARFLIRDRDGKFPSLFDAVLAYAGIEVVLSGVRMPRMNSIMQRWANLPTRVTRPHPDLEPTPSAPRSSGVRTILQRPSAAPWHRQTPDHCTHYHRRLPIQPRSPASHPPTPPPGRHPQRVQTRRLNCTDEVFAKRNVHDHLHAHLAVSGRVMEA
jgi:hypothetical protein